MTVLMTISKLIDVQVRRTLQQHDLHSVSKESQHFLSCLCFGEECMGMNGNGNW